MKEILSKLSLIKDINKGGCGIAAYSIYEWLRKQKIVMKNITFVTLQIGFFRNYHIGIKIDNLVYDVTGLINPKDYQFVEEISVKDLVRLILKKDWWHGDFNRKDISTIETMLDIDLNVIK